MGREGDVLLLAARVDSLDDLAGVLRHLRRRHARRGGGGNLTYRELAARSGYAHGVIGDYLSGKRLPPTDRLDVLADLLGATGEERGALATARDRVEELRRRAATQPGSAAAAWRTLPRDTFSFTGREPELRLLTGDHADPGAVAIYVIGGMAGIGKTALAVHAAHLLAERFSDGSFSCRCRAIRQASGPPILPMCWPGSCRPPALPRSRSRLAWNCRPACGVTGWPAGGCC